MSDLLPCPWCGSQPVSMPVANDAGLMIECLTKGCVNPHVSFVPPSAAIAAWNTRALAPPPADGGEG